MVSVHAWHEDDRQLSPLIFNRAVKSIPRFDVMIIEIRAPTHAVHKFFVHTSREVYLFVWHRLLKRDLISAQVPVPIIISDKVAVTLLRATHHVDPLSKDSYLHIIIQIAFELVLVVHKLDLGHHVPRTLLRIINE